MYSKLQQVGLTEGWVQEAALYRDLKIGRVSSQHKDIYHVITEDGEITAKVSGKFRHRVETVADYPGSRRFCHGRSAQQRSRPSHYPPCAHKKNSFCT